MIDCTAENLEGLELVSALLPWKWLV